VLGRVRVVGAHGFTPPSAAQARVSELAAFLALYRDLGPDVLPDFMRAHALPPMGRGADLDLVDLALWNHTGIGTRARDVGVGRRRVRVARLARLLRSWLGIHPDTMQPYLAPYTVEDGFRLHPVVTTDWAHWCDVLPDHECPDEPDDSPDGLDGAGVSAGPDAAGGSDAPRLFTAVGTADLQAAWALVRGPVLHTTREGVPDWADDLILDIEAEVFAVGEELATRHLREGNLVAAARVAGHGIRLNHYSEEAWRPLITTVATALGLTRPSTDDTADGVEVTGIDGDRSGTDVDLAVDPAPVPGMSPEDWQDWMAERAEAHRRRTRGPLDAVVWALLRCFAQLGWHYLEPATRRLLADLDYPPPTHDMVWELSRRVPDQPEDPSGGGSGHPGLSGRARPGWYEDEVARYAARTALRTARAAHTRQTTSTATQAVRGTPVAHDVTDAETGEPAYPADPTGEDGP
jgi:hypothetical protein